MKQNNSFVAKIAFLSFMFVSLFAVSAASANAMGTGTKPASKTAITAKAAKSHVKAKTSKPKKHKKAKAPKKVKAAKKVKMAKSKT